MILMKAADFSMDFERIPKIIQRLLRLVEYSARPSFLSVLFICHLFDQYYGPKPQAGLSPRLWQLNLN